MNYIAPLTKEEKSLLCSIITGKSFKELFRNNEKEFTKIRKGFRAKSLSEDHALSIAISNVDRPFISTWINIWVERWLNEIQDNIEKLKGEGLSQRSAQATTMLDSVFVDHVDLYFKLSGSHLSEEAYSDFYEWMEYIKVMRVKHAEALERIKALEEEKDQLSNQAEVEQHNTNIMRAEYERKFQEIEHEKSELESQLAKAHTRITELKTAPEAIRIIDTDDLAQFDDTKPSALFSDNADEIISLCSVTSDYNGQKWLIRYADLNHEGRYNTFQRNDGIPSYFENRDKIFYKDGPSDNDFYGIWNWSTVPNKNDFSKDYVQSRYNKEISAIEIVTVAGASSLDDLVESLKNRITHKPHALKVIYSFCESNGQYIGILCSNSDCNTVDGKTALSSECFAVPVYKFTSHDILHLNNGLSFYQSAFAGVPSELYHLKRPLDIVKSAVLSSISWSIYKTRGFVRSEYKTFKKFLDELPVDDVIDKIQTGCHCSEPAAKELLDKFLDVAWQFVDGDSLGDEIIISTISANTELQERTKELIRQDWEAENESAITKAREALDSLHTEQKSISESLVKAQEELKRCKAEEKSLSITIDEKKKLAIDVEVAVAERIQKARENAADFIASMAFLGGQNTAVVCTEATAPDEVTSEDEMVPYHVCSSSVSFSDLEAHHTWADVINTVAFEFDGAGVSEPYRSSLAAFLCAAYLEKQPLFLVGPNAIDIAQAFSAAIAAHRHGILYCEGNYSYQAISKMGTDGEDIVIIHNLLASGWMNRLPEMFSQKDIFFIAIHPYAEDVQVEPKSLYGFMLPLFTEFFVNKKATGKYIGGYFADDFKPHTAQKSTYKELPVLSELALSSLVRSQINRLATTMHSIYPDTTGDDEFLFAIFPIAYALLAMDKLAEAISDTQKGINISAKLKRELRHVLGEA